MGKTVALIGPCGVGKTTVGRLVAQKLDRPFYDLDDLRGRLYRGTGYSRWKAWRALLRGADAWYAYQKPYELLSVRRALAEYPGAVLAFGGGQSVYEGALAEEFLSAAKVAQVVLLMPYRQRERSLALLDRRVDPVSRRLNRRFVGAATNFRAADRVVYTGRRSPEEVAEDIAACCR